MWSSSSPPSTARRIFGRKLTFSSSISMGKWKFYIPHPYHILWCHWNHFCLHYHTPVSQFLHSYFSWVFYILKVKAAIRISNTNNRDYFVNKGLQILLSSCNNVDCSIFRLCTGSMNIIKLLIHSLVSYKSQFKTSKVIQNCTRRRNSRWDSTWLIHCWTLQVHGFWVLWIYGSMLGSIKNHLKFL